MPTVPVVHPALDVLQAFGAGKLDGAIWDEVAEHVESCAACGAQLRQGGEDPFVERLKAVHRADAADAANSADAAKSLRDERATGEPARLEIPAPLRDHPRYRILRVLGAGGMGVVFEAEHRVMERKVALKVINPRLTRKPSIVERFLLEVKAAAKLSHPNVVAAHDAEHAGELLFLVMEYVEGASLDRVVRRHGPLSARHVCHYGRQAALGLEQAAERGLVHRDIKPQNLMLNRRGQIKILDFGLARLAREAMGSDLDVEPASPDGTQLIYTAAGQVLGTPDYIAPEQVTAPTDTDSRADIYSLGCTLYFLLTGRPPFPSGSVAEKLDAHVRREPARLAELRPDLPEDVIGVVERMMEKDRARRHQTPGEVAAALSKAKAASSPESLVPVERPSLVAWDGLWDAAAETEANEQTRVPAPPLAGPTDAAFVQDASSRFPGRWLRQTWQTRRRAIVVGAAMALLLPLLGLLASIAGSFRDHVGGSTATRDVLLVVPPQFTYDDFATIREALDAAPGVHVTVASTSLAPCRPLRYGDERGTAARSSGPDVLPEVTLDDVHRRGPFAAVVLANGNVYPYKDPGSSHADNLRQLISRTNAEGGLVAAIGAGEGVLALGGFLQGRRVSATPAMRQAMDAVAADWSSEPVVVDGRLITAAESRHASSFAEQLVQELGGAK